MRTFVRFLLLLATLACAVESAQAGLGWVTVTEPPGQSAFNPPDPHAVCAIDGTGPNQGTKCACRVSLQFDNIVPATFFFGTVTYAPRNPSFPGCQYLAGDQLSVLSSSKYDLLTSVAIYPGDVVEAAVDVPFPAVIPPGAISDGSRFLCMAQWSGDTFFGSYKASDVCSAARFGGMVGVTSFKAIVSAPAPPCQSGNTCYPDPGVGNTGPTPKPPKKPVLQ